MQFSIDADNYSQTAVLTAIKKQQVSAAWRIEGRSKNSIVLSFDKTQSSLSDDECVRRFRLQLNDEMLREKLESDFGHVRDMLVDVALAPIIGKKEN